MTNINYTLRSDIVTDDENNDHIVYGITAQNNKGEVLDSIPDIFFDKARAQNFVLFCNNEKVSLNELADLAEKQVY